MATLSLTWVCPFHSSIYPSINSVNIYWTHIVFQGLWEVLVTKWWVALPVSPHWTSLCGLWYRNQLVTHSIGLWREIRAMKTCVRGDCFRLWDQSSRRKGRLGRDLKGKNFFGWGCRAREIFLSTEPSGQKHDVPVSHLSEAWSSSQYQILSLSEPATW